MPQNVHNTKNLDVAVAIIPAQNSKFLFLSFSKYKFLSKTPIISYYCFFAIPFSLFFPQNRILQKHFSQNRILQKHFPKIGYYRNIFPKIEYYRNIFHEIGYYRNIFPKIGFYRNIFPKIGYYRNQQINQLMKL